MKPLAQLINKSINLARLGEFIRREHSPLAPVITVSREHGSLGSRVAENVTKRLGRPWRFYHHEIVDRIAKQGHLEKKLLSEIDESRIPLVDQVVAEFFGRRHVSLSAYTRHLLTILSEIGNRGHAVILGRGANYLLPQSFKVRIIGDMNYRIKNIMKYDKYSESVAKKKIIESDKQRVEFSRSLFNHDPRKAHHYDLIIQTSENLSVDDAVHIVLRAAKLRFNL